MPSSTQIGPMNCLALSVKIPLTAATSTGIRPIVIPRRLPNTLPSLRRRLSINTTGCIDGGPSNHHPARSSRSASRLTHGRIKIWHPTGGGTHHPTQTGLILDLVPGHNIHQEIENVGPSNSRRDVVFLKRPSLVLLGVKPGTDGKLQNEKLAGFGEENRGFSGDHTDIFVGFHDLLDASKRKLMVLEVVDLLDFLALVRPEHLELLLLLLEEVVERSRRSGGDGGGGGRRRRRNRSSGRLRRVRGGLGLLVAVHWMKNQRQMDELDQRDKARVSRTSLILWHAHQNDAAAVRKLLEEDRSLVEARDYDNRTPLHVASLHGWIDVAKCLIDYGADVNAQDRWKNTPLADAEGAKKHNMIELLKSHGGLSYGQNGSHFESKPVPPPLPNKCDWEIDPSELDFSNSNIIGKGSFGEILKASWRGTPVAVKRILPSLSDDRLVIQDFRHEVKLLVKLRHPNIVQFLGAVTDRKPLMLITEYLRGGDLHQHLKEKGALHPSTAINFALDIARGMAYLHTEPNVIIHRDLKPRNVLLVNSSADHLKVGDFGLSKLIKVQNSHDVYKMTGETGSYRYMAPEVFKHQKYDKKVDVFSFAMILYQMLEGDPPLSNYEPYEAAKYVADGHRPIFRSKSYLPELRDLTSQCWAADMGQRPSFLDILKRLEKIKENVPSDHTWNIFST